MSTDETAVASLAEEVEESPSEPEESTRLNFRTILENRTIYDPILRSHGRINASTPFPSPDDSQPLEFTAEIFQEFTEDSVTPDSEIWCTIDKSVLKNGAIDSTFLSDTLKIPYEVRGNLLVFTKDNLPKVFDWLQANNEFPEYINYVDDLGVLRVTSTGAEILGLKAIEIPAGSEDWCIIEGFELDIDKLKAEKIPTIPTDQGLSFPSSSLDAVVKMHGIDDIKDYKIRPGSVARLLIYSKTWKNKVTIAHWNGRQQEEFKAITEELLLPVLDCDVKLHVPHEATRSPVDDIFFHIYIWSAPTNRGKATPPPEIWGIPVSCRDSAYMDTETGIVIYDDLGHDVGELVRNNLYIYHDICNNGTAEELKIYRRFLQEASKIIDIGYDEYLKTHDIYGTDLARENYIKSCAGRFKARMDSLTEEIGTNNKDIDEAQEKIVGNIRSNRVLQAQLEGMKNHSEKYVEDYGKEYDNLKNIKGVTEIKIRGGRLVAFTDKIFITFEGTEYYLGKYQINIPLYSKGSIRITNLDDTCIRSGYAHPHIERDGHCCFGNISVGIHKLLGQYQYSMVLQLLMKFIKSVYSSGWYYSITEWPKADGHK